MTLRRQTKLEIDQAIQGGAEPRVPRSGLGLVLPYARQRKVLVSAAGLVTPAGRHFYAATNRTPPASFDWTQQEERAGRSLTIRLLDGSRKTVSRFDPIDKVFKPTVLGRKFYAGRKTRYTVNFPVKIDLTRQNGSIYTRDDDWMPSTAVDLGEIQVSSSLSEVDQLTEVKRQAREWMDRQPVVSGERILLSGYEPHRLDSTRTLQFNSLSYNTANGDPSALMHRPLTAGAPWMFPIPGVCAEAGHDTNDECVAHQLARYIRIKGVAPFTKEQLTQELLNASLELYEDDSENEDLLDCPGTTCAAVRKLCESYGIP